MSTSFQPNEAKPTVPPIQPIDINIPNLPRACKATTIGLTIDGDITEEQLLKAVDVIERREKGYQWQLGDALLEVETRYPRRLEELIEPAGEERREKDGHATRKQAKQIASRYPQGTRVPSLSWTHHRVAAFIDPLEERLQWLGLAVENNWSSRDLEKAIREANKDDDGSTDPDLFVLKEPEVRAYLEKDIADQRAQFSSVPENAPFLRDQLVSRIEASQWQLNRTVESDCDIVREAVCELLGTWQQVFQWLKIRSRIISPPDVRAYLSKLVADGRVSEEKDEKPNSNASGTTSTVYKPKRNPADDKKDEERRQKQLV